MFSLYGKLTCIIIMTDHYLKHLDSRTENCMKYGELIHSKTIEIVATSCQILRLKIHQIW